VRRTAVRLTAVAAAVVVLSACGSTGLSYSDGFGIGQSLAATHVTPLGANSALAACRHQWSLSGPASDLRATWVKGCVAGVRELESSVHQ
jgi:hypothetical protein